MSVGLSDLRHHGEVDDEAQQAADGHGDLPLVAVVAPGREQVQDARHKALHAHKLREAHTHKHTHSEVAQLHTSHNQAK